MRLISIALTLPLALAACQAGELSVDDSIESTQQSIIGGVEDSFDDAVVQVNIGGMCTGTLVAPRIVITAAHCVGDAIDAGFTDVGNVRFGDGHSFFETIGIADMAMHRLYKPPAFLQHDIALIRLERDAPASVTPIPINTRHFSEDDVGIQLRVIGFGNTEGESLDHPNGVGAGLKRQMTVPVKEVRPGHLGLGDNRYNTCQGDSGGPSMVTFDGVEYVAAVTSYGAQGCLGKSYVTRVDTNWDAFLTEVINAWSGPCQNDGVCVEDGCAFPDPDCDVCGMDGVCGSDCARPDFDCPLGGLNGESCNVDSDCETRHCLEAPEDPRIKYCSESCDPTLGAFDSDCAAPLTLCEDQGDGTGQCVYPGTTPGVQGAGCDGGGDCRSGMCDANEGICVEPCGSGQPECLEGYECQSVSGLDVCTVPDAGGCQVASGKGGLESGLLLLLGMLLAPLRRRRNR